MAKIFTASGVWPNGIVLIRILTGYFIFRYSFELFNIGGLLDFLKESGFPFPVFSGYAAKIIELVIYTMNKGNIFQGELPFLFLLLFAVFFICGPGKWSLDHWLENRKKKPIAAGVN